MGDQIQVEYRIALYHKVAYPRKASGATRSPSIYTRYTFIYLTHRASAPNFWRQNGEKLLLVAIGSVITVFIQWLFHLLTGSKEVHEFFRKQILYAGKRDRFTLSTMFLSTSITIGRQATSACICQNRGGPSISILRVLCGLLCFVFLVIGTGRMG